MTIRVTKVKPRSGHRIWLLYSDGVSGVVDLSDLTGKGVFQAWDQPGVFDRVHVAPHGAVAALAHYTRPIRDRSSRIVSLADRAVVPLPHYDGQRRSALTH